MSSARPAFSACWQIRADDQAEVGVRGDQSHGLFRAETAMPGLPTSVAAALMIDRSGSPSGVSNAAPERDSRALVGFTAGAGGEFYHIALRVLPERPP